MVLSDKNSKRLSYLYKTLFIIGTITLIVALFPKEYKFKYRFVENKPWMYEDLIAPFDFAVNKLDEEIFNEKRKLINESSPYFIFDKKIIVNKRKLLVSKFNDECKIAKPSIKKHNLNTRL